MPSRMALWEQGVVLCSACGAALPAEPDPVRADAAQKRIVSFREKGWIVLPVKGHTAGESGICGPGAAWRQKEQKAAGTCSGGLFV